MNFKISNKKDLLPEIKGKHYIKPLINMSSINLYIHVDMYRKKMLSGGWIGEYRILNQERILFGQFYCQNQCTKIILSKIHIYELNTQMYWVNNFIIPKITY